MTTMSTIPTISLSQAGTRQLSEAILDACTGTGFFYLTDVPIEDGLIDTAWTASENLFLDQSEAGTKAKLDSRNRAGNTGYTAMQEEKLAASNPDESVDTSSRTAKSSGSTSSSIKPGDLKESFYIARLNSSTSQDLPPVLKVHQDELGRFFEGCKEVCAIVMKAFAVALGLEEDFFASKHQAGDDDRLRLIHYPPAEISSDGLNIRAGSHSDYGMITLLFQRGVSGLQVLNQHRVKETDQEWIDIPPKKGAIVVNVGDALEFWTAAVFRSTQHRVVMPRSEAEAVSRFSM
jgi:isopenicillin N synthase-like dioxygenase